MEKVRAGAISEVGVMRRANLSSIANNNDDLSWERARLARLLGMRKSQDYCGRDARVPRNILRFSIIAMLVLLAQAAGFPGNWPNWRGPNLSGTPEEKNLPVSWSTTEGITWKLPMPDFSGSTPIVKGG